MLLEPLHRRVRAWRRWVSPGRRRVRCAVQLLFELVREQPLRGRWTGVLYRGRAVHERRGVLLDDLRSSNDRLQTDDAVQTGGRAVLERRTVLLARVQQQRLLRIAIVVQAHVRAVRYRARLLLVPLHARRGGVQALRADRRVPAIRSDRDAAQCHQPVRRAVLRRRRLLLGSVRHRRRGAAALSEARQSAVQRARACVLAARRAMRDRLRVLQRDALRQTAPRRRVRSIPQAVHRYRSGVRRRRRAVRRSGRLLQRGLHASSRRPISLRRHVRRKRHLVHDERRLLRRPELHSRWIRARLRCRPALTVLLAHRRAGV